jgi:hypothetical protein
VLSLSFSPLPAETYALEDESLRLQEAFRWARQDSNLGPTDYESAALTAELRALLRVSVASDTLGAFPAHSLLA